MADDLCLGQTVDMWGETISEEGVSRPKEQIGLRTIASSGRSLCP